MKQIHTLPLGDAQHVHPLFRSLLGSITRPLKQWDIRENDSDRVAQELGDEDNHRMGGLAPELDR